MTEQLTIRSGAEADAPALLAIYGPFVVATAVSFEEVTPTVDEFAARIAKCVANWEWLVAVRAGHCIGYAYASTHRERPAYRDVQEIYVLLFALACRPFNDVARHGNGCAPQLHLQSVALFDGKVVRGLVDARDKSVCKNEDAELPMVAAHASVITSAVPSTCNDLSLNP